MAGGYVGGRTDDLTILTDALRDHARRLSELESPSASQANNTLAQALELARAAVLPVALYRLDSPMVSASLSEFAVISTPVPTGFTRALVSITAGASLRSNDVAGSWALLTVSAGVNGVAGNTGWGSISGQMYGAASSASSQVLTALTDSDTVDVSAFVGFPGTYTLPRVSVAGSILFLR